MRAQGRTAAIAGAVVAVGAATLMGLTTGIASATPAGSCLETVNVRSEPSRTSDIVAICEAGTAVETGQTRNGFVEIVDLGGWAAEEYIAVDDSAPSDTAPSDIAPSDSGPSDSGSDSGPLGSAPVDDEEGATEPVDGTDTGSDDTTGGGTGSGDSTGDDGSTGGTAGDDTAGEETGPADPADPTSGLGGGLI